MELSDVRKVASLARLALDDEELLESGKQLTSILEYVRLLDEVDITGVANDSSGARGECFPRRSDAAFAASRGGFG